MIERDGKIYFTLNEVAEILNVDKSTVSRRLSKENLEVVKEGKKFLIPYETVIRLGASKEQVDAFIQREKNPQRSSDDNEVDKLLQEVFSDINVQEFNNFEAKSSPAPAKSEVVSLPLPSKSKSESKSSKEKEVKAGKDAVKPVEQLLGKSYAEILKPTLESLEWWNTAKELISWHAIMIALQVAKVDPAEIVHKAEEFQDPVKFANYIKELLSAMVEAIEDAQAIHQYREELEQTRRELEACLLVAEKQADRIAELEQDLKFFIGEIFRKGRVTWKDYLMYVYGQRLMVFSFGNGGGEYGGSRDGGSEEIS